MEDGVVEKIEVTEAVRVVDPKSSLNKFSSYGEQNQNQNNNDTDSMNPLATQSK